MEYDVVIGLEVHAQLLTESKMFCRCSARYFDAAPNTLVCPVCMGMPGVLPVINEKAVEYTVMTALALNCSIPEHSKFDRKNYPYPDLMKGYQISQFDMPLSEHGYLLVEVGGEEHKNRILRVHLEEDTARLLHRNEDGHAFTLMDVNRAGVALMEIVGEPDITSPEEARAYLQKLRTILLSIGVSDCRMEEGSFRCDANVSLKPRGAKEYGTKVEVKNMNSFRSVQHALEYEVERQAKVLNDGGRVVQETRGWVEDKNITQSQRSKEQAHDYRYFPEPDLPPMILSREYVEDIRAKLPELPDAKFERYQRDYALSALNARLIADSIEASAYFEEGTQVKDFTPEVAPAFANWMFGDLQAMLKTSGRDFDQSPVTATNLAGLATLIHKGTISGRMGKDIFEKMSASGRRAEDIVREEGLVQISDTKQLTSVIERVIAENQQSVTDWLAGKEKALTYLVGQVMKETRGKANPAMANQLLVARLKQMQGEEVS